MSEPVRGTVYVVDDDTSVRRGIKRLLRSSGYAVEDFASAEEFLAHERPAGSACAILDLRMPRMTGAELFDRIASSGAPLPVVFLTAHGDVPTSVRAIKRGAVDFLLKPVEAEPLLRAVEEAIHRHRAETEIAGAKATLGAKARRLSKREREVMLLVVRGEPNKRIGELLGISEKTVKTHRHRVMEKMEAGSLAELVRLAAALPSGS